MFCGNCGAQNSDAKFCASCGTALIAASTAAPAEEIPAVVNSQGAPLPSQPTPPRKSFGVVIAGLSKKSKIFIFGGAGLVVLVVIAIVTTIALTPYSLDSAKAHRIMMTVSEFDFSMKEDDSKTDITEVDGPIYNTSDKCGADTAAVEELDGAKVLASARYSNSDDNFVYFKEDILQFDSSNAANDFIKTIKDGFGEDGCEYHSSGWDSDNVNLSDAQGVVGAGGSSSVAVEMTNVVDSGTYSWDQRETYIAVVRGKFVFVISGSVDVSESGVSESDMRDALKYAVSKIS